MCHLSAQKMLKNQTPVRPVMLIKTHPMPEIIALNESTNCCEEVKHKRRFTQKYNYIEIVNNQFHRVVWGRSILYERKISEKYLINAKESQTEKAAVKKQHQIIPSCSTPVISPQVSRHWRIWELLDGIKRRLPIEQACSLEFKYTEGRKIDARSNVQSGCFNISKT